jgi:hypothetical protein
MMVMLGSSETSALTRATLRNILEDAILQNWVNLARRSLFGLLYHPPPRWWMMLCAELSVEWVAEETEVPGENLSQCIFMHHTSYMILYGLEPGPLLLEAEDWPFELRHGHFTGLVSSSVACFCVGGGEH